MNRHKELLSLPPRKELSALTTSSILIINLKMAAEKRPDRSCNQNGKNSDC